jgi:phospholipid transport system substrate-binding protein
MSQRTLGPYWDEASSEQRQHFSKLFVAVLEGTYLNRIDDYSSGKVQFLQQRIKDDKAIVDTLIKSKDIEVPVQYRMVYQNDRWQIFDMVIDGVSLIKNYSSSYREIIRREGFAGLFALMENKVAEMNAS